MKWNLDALPAWARHLALLVLAAVLAWAGEDLVPLLQGEAGLAGLVGIVITMLLAVLTPLTTQYGRGSE